MKVEFAPRNIPLERRLQTAAVLQWVFSFLCLAQCCIAVFIFLLFTRFWVVSALYAVWWAFDWDTPSQGIHSVSSNYLFKMILYTMLNPLARKFCKTVVVLVKTVDLDPCKNYLFGFHPHGILVAGAFVNFCTEATGFSKLFPGLTPHMMMLNLWFRAPFFRDYLMSGGLIPSDKESGSYLLRKKEGGNIVIIAVGGAQEALDAARRIHPLVEESEGLRWLAIENGTALVPVFSFGENELFDQVENPKGSWLRWTQECLQKIMGISLPLFHARGIFQYTFGVIPYRKPIYTVVGKPLQVTKKHNPSQDEVDKLHKSYLEALCKLFEENKLKYNVPEDTHLSFI